MNTAPTVCQRAPGGGTHVCRRHLRPGTLPESKKSPLKVLSTAISAGCGDRDGLTGPRGVERCRGKVVISVIAPVPRRWVRRLGGSRRRQKRNSRGQNQQEKEGPRQEAGNSRACYKLE